MADDTSTVFTPEYKAATLREEIREKLGQNIGSLILISLMQDDMKPAFAIADADGDGFINQAELAGLMAMLGEPDLSEEDVAALFGEADADGDGRINYPEWCKTVIGTCQPA